MLFQFVIAVDGDLDVSTDTDIDRLVAKHGRSITGYNKNDRVRPELRDQPKISGMNGPMWGGLQNGEIVLRYEDPEAYSILST
ncbi:hypothetical protein [Aminobacter sp. MET-1]|uniref:hypothetical protein n=1 Tax=Aminobacter sp. MET-1 TaxID=2951085 RepID=UPI002269E905|nr:hypothetical protein [Aminobacter sp. MET-1]MCX8571075.1 hypothetical protein [Aminobacter sp. MET-1]MCX8573256.1 hypothetical protein [Aminobacter sp. MET-1]